MSRAFVKETTTIRDKMVKNPTTLIRTEPLLCVPNSNDNSSGISYLDFMKALFQAGVYSIQSSFFKGSTPLAIPGCVTRVVNFTTRDVTVIDPTGTRFSAPKVAYNDAVSSVHYYSRGLIQGSLEITHIIDFLQRRKIRFEDKVMIAKAFKVVGDSEAEVFESFYRLPISRELNEKSIKPVIIRGSGFDSKPLWYAECVLFYFVASEDFRFTSDVLELNTSLQLTTKSVAESGAHYLDQREDLIDLSDYREYSDQGDIIMTTYRYTQGTDGVVPTHRFFRDPSGTVTEIPVVKSTIEKDTKLNIVKFRKKAGRNYVDRIAFKSKDITEENGFFRSEEEASVWASHEDAKARSKAFDSHLKSLMEKITAAVKATCEDFRNKVNEERKNFADLRAEERKFKDKIRELEDKHKEELTRVTREKDAQIAKEKDKLEDLKKSRSHIFDGIRNVTVLLTSILAIIVAVKPFLGDKKKKQ